MKPNNFNVKGVWKEREGSVAEVHAGGHCIILNLCSVSGDVWDKDSELGLVSKRWPKGGLEYRRWYLGQYRFNLGNISEVNVQSTVCIANALVKDAEGNFVPEALEKAIDRVGEMAYEYGSSVHVQKQGSEEDWNAVTELLKDKIIKRSKNVIVYSLKE
mgnify:CR=1 FL=1